MCVTFSAVFQALEVSVKSTLCGLHGCKMIEKRAQNIDQVVRKLLKQKNTPLAFFPLERAIRHQFSNKS